MSNEVIQILALDRYQRRTAEAMEKYGHVAVDQGDFAKAHYHFYFAYCHLVTIWQKIAADIKDMAYLLSFSAQSVIAQGNNILGIKLSYEAIDKFHAFLQSNPDEAHIQESYNTIAMCYKDIVDANLKEKIFNEAIKNYQIAFNIFKKLKHPIAEIIIDCLIHLGFTFAQVEHYGFAVTIFNEAFSRINSIEDFVLNNIELSRQLSDCYDKLGQVYATKEDLPKSLENYTKQYNILRQFPEAHRIEADVSNMQFFEALISASSHFKGVSSEQVSQCRPGR